MAWVLIMADAHDNRTRSEHYRLSDLKKAIASGEEHGLTIIRCELVIDYMPFLE